MEEQFNKEEFSIFLERAKGNRSINQFANETGVSAAHISRFLRQMIASPPTPETISKFAAKAHNEVTYQDFMVAAGHLGRKSGIDDNSGFVSIDSPMNARRQAMDLERKFVQVILANLFEMPFKWSVEKKEDRMRFPDMVLNIDHEGYKKWYLEFKPFISDTPSLSMLLTRIYGQIAIFELLETDKFTIVVNSENAFNSLLKRPPISLRVNLYVMLIDLERGNIVKEEVLCRYVKD